MELSGNRLVNLEVRKFKLPVRWIKGERLQLKYRFLSKQEAVIYQIIDALTVVFCISLNLFRWEANNILITKIASTGS